MVAQVGNYAEIPNATWAPGRSNRCRVARTGLWREGGLMVPLLLHCGGGGLEQDVPEWTPLVRRGMATGRAST